MSNLEIIEVNSPTKLRTFIKLPIELYKDLPCYVPHLLADRYKFFDKNKNPFFKHARVKHFLAYIDGNLAGRISGIINDLHNDYHDEKTGFFGFFDCIDDLDVAVELFDRAYEFVKNEGMDSIRGPANFSTNDEVGLLIDGFDSFPTFMMTYNPPYYIDLYEKLGLEKLEDLIAFYIDEKSPPSKRILNIAEKMRSRGKITLRTINMNNFEKELEIIRTIYNAAWSENWGFIPMTPDEFTYIADDFKKLVDPDLIFLAFIDGQPAGFSLAMPDYNPIFKKMNGKLFPLGLLKFLYHTKIKKSITGLRLITMGVVHKYQKTGLDMIFFLNTYNEGVRKGYRWAEISWVLERNTLMNKSAVLMGARPYKKYRIYEKSITR
ncbi:MAG: N-acetyltransferase [candidate division Zixibacteria bacterium]